MKRYCLSHFSRFVASDCKYLPDHKGTLRDPPNNSQLSDKIFPVVSSDYFQGNLSYCHYDASVSVVRPRPFLCVRLQVGQSDGNPFLSNVWTGGIGKFNGLSERLRTFVFDGHLTVKIRTLFLFSGTFWEKTDWEGRDGDGHRLPLQGLDVSN